MGIANFEKLKSDPICKSWKSRNVVEPEARIQYGNGTLKLENLENDNQVSEDPRFFGDEVSETNEDWKSASRSTTMTTLHI
uniref:Uncharacterized protein n=1 Tax=Megaselia scalaris TaxID=36166 RepID=T1GHZ1_MEGSC